MKTAVQQAFARLEELHPSLFDIHTEKGRTFVNEFSKFLEVEREQIINCSIQTTQDCYIAIMEQLNAPIQFTDEDLSNQKLEAEQYYNETFKSETLTYTEAAKKEERIFNSTMMSKQETFKSE